MHKLIYAMDKLNLHHFKEQTLIYAMQIFPMEKLNLYHFKVQKLICAMEIFPMEQLNLYLYHFKVQQTWDCNCGNIWDWHAPQIYLKCFLGSILVVSDKKLCTFELLSRM